MQSFAKIAAANSRFIAVTGERGTNLKLNSFFFRTNWSNKVYCEWQLQTTGLVNQKQENTNTKFFQVKYHTYHFFLSLLSIQYITYCIVQQAQLVIDVLILVYSLSLTCALLNKDLFIYFYKLNNDLSIYFQQQTYSSITNVCPYFCLSVRYVKEETRFSRHLIKIKVCFFLCIIQEHLFCKYFVCRCVSRAT